MKLNKAIRYLENVLEHKQCIPILRFTGHGSRTAQSKEFKANQGKWPAKSVKHVLSLLKNLHANAESKGLDADKCVISHAATQRAVQGRRRTYRAHGRITPYLSSNCHVEFHATEKAESVKKGAEAKKAVRLTKKQAAR